MSVCACVRMCVCVRARARVCVCVPSRCNFPQYGSSSLNYIIRVHFSKDLYTRVVDTLTSGPGKKKKEKKKVYFVFRQGTGLKSHICFTVGPRLLLKMSPCLEEHQAA